MLNPAVGSLQEIDGKRCILTREGSSGHAVYGPYQHLDPGRYVVEFNLAAIEGQQFDRDDVCATVDVAADFGRMIFGRQDVMLSRLRDGPLALPIVFKTDVSGTFEFRVGISGRAPLLIDDYCRVLPLDDKIADCASVLDATRFPDPLLMPKPAFFLQNRSSLRRLYEGGAAVAIIDNDVIVTIDGVSFYARISDDLRFIDEIFFRSAYNFLVGRDCCVIDIGMNIGLVSMTFARKAEVREVHSFEPFKATYQRACANISLNPDIASKISANNFGLAGTDEESTVLIYDEGDSGAYSIRGSANGAPHRIHVRNAAVILKPIIEAAKANGRQIIAKVDCEGSEFPIFEVLEAHGLICDISAFMVEWHRGLGGKTQRDLIAPLMRHGFTVFDQTGRTGNGFFYAVRSWPTAEARTTRP